jgi:hypothetical protein
VEGNYKERAAPEFPLERPLNRGLNLCAELHPLSRLGLRAGLVRYQRP